MLRPLLLASAALPLLAASPAKAPPTRDLTCAVPVKRDDTAASLKKRHGAQAVTMSIHAAEGEMVDGMALWPNDPKRRIDIFFEERPPNFVETIRITGDKSAWRIGGFGIGSRLDAVVRANRRAVRVGGFGWDYGGGVDARGGRLTRWPGGCRISVVMDVGPDVNSPPEKVFGDGITMGSNDALLKSVRPVVTTIFVSWPWQYQNK